MNLSKRYNLILPVLGLVMILWIAAMAYSLLWRGFETNAAGSEEPARAHVFESNGVSNLLYLHGVSEGTRLLWPSR